MTQDSALTKTYLECEKTWAFVLLMLVGGCFGAFTYSLRGGVFCNAQTANFVLFALALGNGAWRRALYFFIPMGAYLMGAIISEALPKYLKAQRFIRWTTILMLIEIITVFILGILPDNAPFQVTQVSLNFICSMQYNTFRQAQDIPMATTFCTNHLRQLGIWIVKLCRGVPNAATRVAKHFFMLGVFVCGAILTALLCRRFSGRAIWITLLPLIILFVDFLYADLVTERHIRQQSPGGQD